MDNLCSPQRNLLQFHRRTDGRERERARRREGRGRDQRETTTETVPDTRDGSTENETDVEEIIMIKKVKNYQKREPLMLFTPVVTFGDLQSVYVVTSFFIIVLLSSPLDQSALP